MPTAVRAPRTAPPDRDIAVVAPVKPPTAEKSWRRLVTGIDASAPRGTRQVSGPWLEPGTAYSVPAGAVLLSCDRYRDHWHITMALADSPELSVVKEWELKSPLGKRVTDYVGRRLPAGASRMSARLLEDRPNRWAGRCCHCRRPVDAGAGRLVAGSTSSRVAHRDGECPPPPPPPQIISPNRRGEPCALCADWVEPGTGIALRMSERDSVSGSWYRAAHQKEPGACPPGALPGPRNRVAGWCAECGEMVRPGEGFWAPWTRRSLRHAGSCPAPKVHGPSWLVRRHRHEDAYEVGQIRRVRVDLRRGGDDVPLDVPGRRVLAEHYVELIALVVETVQRGRRQWARVCPATGGEAADDLAGDVVAALGARPDVGAFTASWSAENIGDASPWLAELAGRDPDFVYERRFVKPRRDYRNANSRGTRGVVFNWTLLPGRVYEALEPLSRRSTRRLFLRATAAGDVVEITREEAEAWLNHSPAWADS
jgi:hypothetical protein